MTDAPGGELTLDFDDDFALPEPEGDGGFDSLDFIDLPDSPDEPVRPVFDPWALRPYESRALTPRVCVFDTETDRFGQDVSIAPFTCGFKDMTTGDYTDFWGDDCIDQFFAWFVETYQKAGIQVVVYVHNLGGFDLHFMLQWLDTGTFPVIINGRMSSVRLGGQEWRDSYRIIPIPLGAFEKDTFDYSKNDRDVREKYKDEILLYQRHDCDSLGTLVSEFIIQFGDRPTIGNTAMNYLRSFHGFQRMGLASDNLMRPFFHGGRCQSFKTGVFPGAWKIYDVTSMYPHVMRSFEHPISSQILRGRTINKGTGFIEWYGENRNAIPTRQDDGSLDFTVEKGTFRTSIHEWNKAQELNLIRPHAIIQTYGFTHWSTFGAFIDYFFEARKEAQANGDRLRDIFYKLIMNSAYGKFAQDPRRYESYMITVGAFPDQDDMFKCAGGGCGEGACQRPDAGCNRNGWKPKVINGSTYIWAKPSPNRLNGFFNCATGASITGASRAVLMDGLSKAKNRLYCDTDSIVCEGLSGVDMDGARLGGWKLECEGDLFACAGKKLYALFTRDREAWVKVCAKMKPDDAKKMSIITWQGVTMYCIKKASKGSVLSGQQILDVANGAEILYVSDRPNFNLDGSVEYVKRVIKRTGK